MTTPAETTYHTLQEAFEDNAVILHNSMLSRVTDCEKRFEYEYIRGWKQGTSLPLKRGSWFHALAAADNVAQGYQQATLIADHLTFDVGVDGVDDLAVLPDDMVLHHEATGAQYPLNAEGVLAYLTHEQWNKLPRDIRETLEGDDSVYEGMSFPEQVFELYTRWRAHAEEKHGPEKILAVEHEWTREHEGLTFGGKIDVVVQRPDGSVVVRDYKSTGSVPSTSHRLTNLQTVLYAWGIEPFLNDRGIDSPRFVELDYVITSPPGLLRLKKPIKDQYAEALGVDPSDYTVKQMEALAVDTGTVVTGEPYANVGQMDWVVFLRQCNQLGEDPMDAKFAGIREQIDSFTDDDHPFFRRWEMPVNAALVGRLLQERQSAYWRARDITVMSDWTDVAKRNLHPVLCQMCPFSEQCALEFHGAQVEAPYGTGKTLPLVGGGEVACDE